MEVYCTEPSASARVPWTSDPQIIEQKQKKEIKI